MSLRFISLPIDNVSLRKIVPSQSPLRESTGDIDTLCESISKLGLLQPILVRNCEGKEDFFEVVCGNRRFEACKRLRWRTIPCHIVELSDKEAYEVALTENLERKTLEPIEEARAFETYVSKAGWGGISELSKIIGKSPSYVSKRVRLLQLPPYVYDQIFRRRKNVTLGEELLSLDSEEQLQISKAIESQHISSREMRKLVESIKHSRPSVAALKKDRTYDDQMSWSAERDRQRLVSRCIEQTISALRLALVRLDGVLDKLDKAWVEKEILMQYRVTLHSQIDSLVRLRKKMSR